MNKFLYDYLPLCYSRIYKAVIQKNGSEIIGNAISHARNNVDESELFPDSETNKLSRDTYMGLRDVEFLIRRGYYDLLEPLEKNKDRLIIKDVIEGIVLRIEGTDRWEKYDGKQSYDIVLAIPKWSRVVAVSTTEILPRELIAKIKLFDSILLENFHYYDLFNRLHGVAVEML